MRKQFSQFDQICNFLNSHPVGSDFTSKEYISAIGHTENLTKWKRYNGNMHYICHQYKGYLRRGGFIKSTKRGTWTVLRAIPSWFTLGHLQFLIGYGRTSTYKGMTKDEIRSLLNTPGTYIITKKMDTISQKQGPSNVTSGSSKLPKMRSKNWDVYHKFIEFTKESGKTFYRTQSELLAAIEKIKFPYVKNNDTKNRYSANNYENIITHLMNDGIITFVGKEKNCLQYRVNLHKNNVNNTAERIVTNSTYGYKTENHPLVKTATVKKIEPKDSEFFNEPSLSTGDQRIDIAVNVGVLESAKAVLSQFTSNDPFERARVYNVIVQLEHISKQQQEKANLL